MQLPKAAGQKNLNLFEKNMFVIQNLIYKYKYRNAKMPTP